MEPMELLLSMLLMIEAQDKLTADWLDWIGVISAIGIVLVGISTLCLTYYLAFKSPPAKLSKLDIKERIRIKLYKHYTRLDDKIFSPLSSIIASTPGLRGHPNPFIELFSRLKLEYNLKSIPESRFYPKALKHLEKDYSGYDYENDVKSLHEEIDELNRGVIALQAETEKKVESSLRIHARIADKFPLPPDSIYLPSILEILGDYWNETLSKYKKGEKSLKEILSKAKPFKMRYKKEMEGGYIKYGAWGIMPDDITLKKEDEIISAIDQLVKSEELIKKLLKLEKKQGELILRSKKIAEKFDKISDMIDSEEYETVASCCPTGE